MILKAVWVEDYDIASDSVYKRPGCPECDEPIGKADNRYYCFACGKEVEVADVKMIAWFKERDGQKVEMTDCICGGEGTVKSILFKNLATLEWQVGCGECSKCGMKFIV